MQPQLERQDECRSPFLKPVRLLERLSPAARADLEALLHVSSYPPGMAIFTEGEAARGIYIVLSGDVRVSIGSADGKRLNLRIVRQGELLGLSSVLSESRYNATAEALYPARLAYLGREPLLAFLARHPDAYLPLVEELSRKLSVACGQLRTVALSHSAPEKLARLLLEWSENGPSGAGGSIRFTLTHEEIGEFIGASRETVTRTLASFKRRHLVRFEGSMLTIPDRAALASQIAE
ncbi:MAG: Crp/Fnr family transcriptional regulator [Acidobacteriota bacterium]